MGEPPEAECPIPRGAANKALEQTPRPAMLGFAGQRMARSSTPGRSAQEERLTTMTKRRWTILAVGLGCAVGALVLVWLVFVYSNPLKVTVRNETSATVSGVTLVCGHGDRTSVPDVGPGESVTVQPRVAPGEDSLTIVDSRGRVYYVLGYFEDNPGGRVTITITSASDGDISVEVRDETDYSPAGLSTPSPDGR
jgi:hypothetical protein